MAQVPAQQSQWGDELHAAGLRVTAPRVVVLDALRQRPHGSAEQLLQLARQQIAGLSLQSVYNVLADLTAHGLARSLELPHSPGLYELDLGDNHHHAVCTNCGALADVPCALGQAPCLTPSHDHGMAIQVADVLYRGLCTSCQSQSAQPATH